MFLVIGMNYWGTGDDLATAKREHKKAGGKLSLGYAIVEFGPELTFTGVDMIGQVHWTGNGDPKVTQVRPRGKKAVWA